MLKNRIVLANIIYFLFLGILAISLYFLLSSPYDGTDGSFLKNGFYVGTIYTEDNNLELGDTILEVNGNSINDILEKFIGGEMKFSEYEFGQINEYTVLRNGEKIIVNQKIEQLERTRFYKTIYNYIIAIFIGTVGYFTVISSPNIKDSFRFFGLTLSIGLTIAPGIFESFHIISPYYLTSILSATIGTLGIVTLPYFFLTFPNDLLGKGKKYFLAINITVGLLMTIPMIFLPLRLVERHYYFVQGYYIFIMMQALMFVLSFFLSLFKTKDATQKQQVKYMAYGLLISVVPGMGGLIVPFIMKRLTPISYELITTLLALFPIFILLAVKKYKLFLIDKIISKTLTYALVSLSLIIVTVPLIFLTFSISNQNLTISDVINFIPAILIISLIIEPLRNFSTNLINIVFYRNKLELISASEKALNALNFINTFKDLYKYIRENFTKHLSIKNADLWIVQENNVYKLDEKFSKQIKIENVSAEKFEEILKKTETIRINSETSEFKYWNKYKLVIPIVLQEKTKGFLLLGEKMSEDFYYEEDINILKTLAKQIGLVIYNSELIKTLKQKARKEKEVLQREIELKKLKEEFVVVISHYLRTPLTAIRGYLSNVVNGVSKKFENDVDGISIGVRKLQSLTETLINISSLEKGELPIHKIPNDLTKIIREAENDNKPLAKKKKVTIRNTVTGGFEISIDRNKIKEAFSNLIENAIVYNKEGGSVDIWMEKAEDHYAIHIKDTGKGISKQELKKIFVPFHRAHYEKEGFILGEGPGLGLYLAKLVVEAHGGTIQIESIEGEGTEVIIVLQDK